MPTNPQQDCWLEHGVFHCKENKTASKIVEALNILFSETSSPCSWSESVLLAAKTLPHHILPARKTTSMDQLQIILRVGYMLSSDASLHLLEKSKIPQDRLPKTTIGKRC